MFNVRTVSVPTSGVAITAPRVKLPYVLPSTSKPNEVFHVWLLPFWNNTSDEGLDLWKGLSPPLWI